MVLFLLFYSLMLSSHAYYAFEVNYNLLFSNYAQKFSLYTDKIAHFLLC